MVLWVCKLLKFPITYTDYYIDEPLQILQVVIPFFWAPTRRDVEGDPFFALVSMSGNLFTLVYTSVGSHSEHISAHPHDLIQLSDTWALPSLRVRLDASEVKQYNWDFQDEGQLERASSTHLCTRASCKRAQAKRYKRPSYNLAFKW